MSDDQDIKIKDLKQQLENSNNEIKRLETVEWDKPYTCFKCKSSVNYTFILPMIKNSGLCPRCFHE